MRKLIFLLILLSSFLATGQSDNDCYRIMATHKKKNEKFPFFLYNTTSINVDGDYKRIVITKFSNDTLFVRYRTVAKGKANWSDIKPIKLCQISFLVYEGLGFEKVRPKRFTFSIEYTDEKKFCNPKYWVEGSPCPYP